jgi:hypothetical protein
MSLLCVPLYRNFDNVESFFQHAHRHSDIVAFLGVQESAGFWDAEGHLQRVHRVHVLLQSQSYLSGWCATP